MFRPSLGALGVNVSSIPKIYESRTTELPVTYSAGNPMTTRISRQNPIARLECRLTGSYLATTSNATAKPFGIMGVIRSLELRLDGDQLLVNLPGYMLLYHTQFYDAWKPYSKDPLFTTGATAAQQAFEYAFTINLDCGGYMSLLDASRNQELSLKINWGTVDDVATPAGTHAFTVAPQLEVSTVSIIGQDPGLIGGVDYVGYWRHILNFMDQPIVNTQSEQLVEMAKNRWHSGLAFFCFDNGAFADGILNKATIRNNQLIMHQQSSSVMRNANLSRYKLSTPWTGIRVYDFCDPEHMEHMLYRSGTQQFDLVLDVTKTSNPCAVQIYTDHFIFPKVAKSAA